MYRESFVVRRFPDNLAEHLCCQFPAEPGLGRHANQVAVLTRHVLIPEPAGQTPVLSALKEVAGLIRIATPRWHELVQKAVLSQDSDALHVGGDEDAAVA